MLNYALTKAICNIKNKSSTLTVKTKICITLLFRCPLTTRWLVYCTIDTMFVFTCRRFDGFTCRFLILRKSVMKLTQIFFNMIYLLSVVCA